MLIFFKWYNIFQMLNFIVSDSAEILSTETDKNVSQSTLHAKFLG